MTERAPRRLCLTYERRHVWFSNLWADTELAKAVCHLCPFEASCLEENLTMKHGIVGGTDPDERAAILRARAAAKAKRPLAEPGAPR